MIKVTVNFEDKNVSKKASYKNKKPYDVYEIDTEKILVSKKESYGKKGDNKYFVGYNGEDVIRPLCVTFLQMIMLKMLMVTK